jgi:hypothetical protein
MKIVLANLNDVILLGQAGIGSFLLLIAYFLLRKDMTLLARAFALALIGALASVIILLPTASPQEIIAAAATWRHVQPLVGWLLTFGLVAGVALPLPCGIGAVAMLDKAGRERRGRRAYRALIRKATRRLHEIRNEMK